MKKYSNYKSNYDKYPVVQVSETSEMFVGKAGRKLYRS